MGEAEKRESLRSNARSFFEFRAQEFKSLGSVEIAFSSRSKSLQKSAVG